MSSNSPINQIRYILFTLILCAPTVFMAPAASQEIGDRIVVTATFETLITNKKVDKVFEGNVHTITASEGKWRMLSDVKGWIPVQYLMDLEMGLKHFSKRISQNDKDYIAFAHRGMIFHETEITPRHSLT